jgi:hypothetical protein
VRLIVYKACDTKPLRNLLSPEPQAAHSLPRPSPAATGLIPEAERSGAGHRTYRAYRPAGAAGVAEI